MILSWLLKSLNKISDKNTHGFLQYRTNEQKLVKMINLDKMRYLKIGQELVCIKQNTDNFNGDERLILGETYKIIDVDIRFPNRVCVRLIGPYYFHNEYVPIDCFSDIAAIRNKKLTDLGIK